MLVIEIAGGILLAILILATLPWILAGASLILVVVLIVAFMGPMAWMIWSATQSIDGLVALYCRRYLFHLAAL
jgi:hypothetical protein